MNVAETDYYNNIAVCNIIYEPSRLHAYNCHIPDDYEHNFIAQFYTPRAYAGKFNFAQPLCHNVSKLKSPLIPGKERAPRKQAFRRKRRAVRDSFDDFDLF